MVMWIFIFRYFYWHALLFPWTGELYDRYIFNIIRDYQIVFLRDCTIFLLAVLSSKSASSSTFGMANVVHFSISRRVFSPSMSFFLRGIFRGIEERALNWKRICIASIRTWDWLKMLWVIIHSCTTSGGTETENTRCLPAN